MSIRAMTWAFALPLEPRAKIALLAIADNARDDGVAWPSRDTIAEKSSQSRTTVNRRLKLMSDLNVLEVKERYREDGTQTTDEIRLNLAMTPEDLRRRLGVFKENGGVDDEQDEPENNEGVGCPVDTLPAHSGHPGDAVGAGGGLHSGHPHEPSLEPKDSPPNPPPGGPLSKADKEAEEKRAALWQRFLGSYRGISGMDQQEAKAEFDRLSVDDAEWAVAVCPAYDASCRELKKPPKNAHLWLRKGMFRNFPRAKIEPPPAERVWIVEGSDADRALAFVRGMARKTNPFIHVTPQGRGYYHPKPVGDDLIAMLAFTGDVRLHWAAFTRGTAEFASWQKRFSEWLGQGLPVEPGSENIRAPCRWPPSKEGKIYRDDDNEQGNAA